MTTQTPDSMAEKKECPHCESTDLGDRWVRGRKLQIYCRECGWKAEPRTPERQRIQTTRFVSVDQFGGFNYEVFDQYGHTAIHSRTYRSWAEAEKALLKDLRYRSPEEGRRTGVLWPATVKVKGKKYLGPKPEAQQALAALDSEPH